MNAGETLAGIALPLIAGFQLSAVGWGLEQTGRRLAPRWRLAVAVRL